MPATTSTPANSTDPSTIQARGKQGQVHHPDAAALKGHRIAESLDTKPPAQEQQPDPHHEGATKEKCSEMIAQAR
jgi:hypothetical protein